MVCSRCVRLCNNGYDRYCCRRPLASPLLALHALLALLALTAVLGLQVVIIAAPANAHPDLLRAVAPFVDDGAAVGALFAQVRGGKEGTR